MELHHVEVAYAPATEDTARRAYLLGLTEVEKPEDLEPSPGREE